MNRTSLAIILGIAGLVSMLLILGVTGTPRSQTQPYGPALLGVCIAVGAFVVNFSFFEYRFSPYVQTRRGVSNRQLWGSGAIITLTLLPLIGFVFSPPQVVTLALSVLPFLAVGTIVLLSNAKEDTDPSTRLEILRGLDTIKEFLKDFADKAEKEVKYAEKLDLIEPEDKSFHDARSPVSPPATTNDPLSECVGFAIEAMDLSDPAVFHSSIQSLLAIHQVVGKAAALEPAFDETKLKDLLQRHARESFERLGEATLRMDRSGVFSHRFSEAVSTHLLGEARQDLHLEGPNRALIKVLSRFTIRTIEEGRTGIGPKTIATLKALAMAGFYSDRTEEPMYSFGTAGPIRQIRVVGEAAIEHEDDEATYRAIDALGWIGCAALKRKLNQPLRTAVASIAHLGRLSRYHEVPCFWDRCPHTPWEHATRRMVWILSWLKELNNEHQQAMKIILETGVSRLYGKEVKIEQSEGDHEFKVSDLDYIESRFDHEGLTELDFSNPSMTVYVSL